MWALAVAGCIVQRPKIAEVHSLLLPFAIAASAIALLREMAVRTL